MLDLPRTDRPLRIAMTSYYMPSMSKIGVGYQVHAFANGMSDRGHDVTLFTVCPPTEGARYRTISLPSPRRMRTFAFAWSMRSVDLTQFDVLHAHGDDYWLWRRRVPAHIRTMHGSCLAEAARIPGAKEKLRMLALAAGETLATLVADQTAVVSPDTRRYMPWVTTVIPNGVDPRTFYPDPSQRAVAPTILFVGTYANRKRGRLLMEVFAREIRPQVLNAELIMVCSDAPCAPGVTVTGRVSDHELAALYRRAWVFCLPSSYEGFGIPYAEALLSGTPVVASGNAGARFVLENGKYGFIAADSQLGPHLVDLLTDSGRLNRERKKAASRAPMFELGRVIESYETLYGKAMFTSHSRR
jgi:phosphatidylinositol alpha-mannosyltransferase